MKTFRSVVLVVLVVLSGMLTGSVEAQCSGRATPIRDLVARRPVLSTLQKISAASRSRGCSGVKAAASCSGAVSSCSMSVVPSAPAPQASAACGCADCTCVDCKCASAVSVSSSYSQAMASARYRAANRIHGHTSLDTHRTSGVGYASHDPTPDTCLGRGGDSYAVAQGADGWYSTKMVD